MKIFIILAIALLPVNGLICQQDTALLGAINKSISNHLLQVKSTWHISADSSVAKHDTLKLFFNIGSSYSKGAMPGSMVEMLPELLMSFTGQTHMGQLLLLAQNRADDIWKTLDYYSDEPIEKPYVEPANYDHFIPAKGFPSVQQGIWPTLGSNPHGILTNKTVWLSPGHGWYNENGTGFTTQRGTSNELVEDFITAESIDYYLAAYLGNAGANVWTVRERDINTQELIVDNSPTSASYAETGNWVDGTIPGYGGTYRVATSGATETATATFIPAVTQSGYYWVSVRYISGANRTTDVPVIIWHSGDSTTYHINQEVHGDTWVYLGQFYFTAAGNNKVVISNRSADTGQAVIADAIRLGGGIGQLPDCTNGGAASGKPRFEESAGQYAPYQGYTTCRNDVVTRPFYTEWELAKGLPSEINNAVYVAWHTNAGGGTGTETYSYNGAGSSQPLITPGSVELRNYIHNQVVADIRAGWKSTWADRGVKTANFGELRELRMIPGTLLELAFHDLAADANELKHPEFRKLAARAIYKGIVKFFSNRDGIPLVILPEEPDHVVAKNMGSGRIQLRWNRPLTGSIFGDAAIAYKVYISANGRSYANGVTVTDTSYLFSGAANTTYYFKISALNTGGESFTSSVVAARMPVAGNSAFYLVVDGFDRLDRSALIVKNENATLGNVKRMFIERMNRYDYMIEHAEALASCNISFDGCQNEAVSSGNVLLTDYTALDWFTGEESTVDRSLDSVEKVLLKGYLDNGGSLIISGAEIGWDIGRAASANADLNFYNNYLKASFVGDDANTYAFSGTPALFGGQNGTFDNSTNGYYDVDFPDRIAANGGSSVVLNYMGGTADGAAIGYLGNHRLIYFAFPFEAITSTPVRNNLMCNAIGFLTPALAIKDLSLNGEHTIYGNKLHFNTKAETNTAYFFVERSENGIFYDSLSNRIKPVGNASHGADYTYIDKQHVSAYYRIRAVDFNGSFSLSNTVFLRSINATGVFTVLNPVRDLLNIQLIQRDAGTLAVYNGAGQLVYSMLIKTGASNQIRIPVHGLPKGMYTITIRSATNAQTEKVVVQ